MLVWTLISQRSVLFSEHGSSGSRLFPGAPAMLVRPMCMEHCQVGMSSFPSCASVP